MIWWVLLIALLSVVSYLSEMGLYSFFRKVRIPLIDAPLLSVLIMFAAFGLLARMLYMKGKGLKEAQQKRIQELESQLAGKEPPRP